MKKRILTLFLAVVMAMAMVPATFAASTPQYEVLLENHDFGPVSTEASQARKYYLGYYNYLIHENRYGFAGRYFGQHIAESVVYGNTTVVEKTVYYNTSTGKISEADNGGLRIQALRLYQYNGSSLVPVTDWLNGQYSPMNLFSDSGYMIVENIERVSDMGFEGMPSGKDGVVDSSGNIIMDFGSADLIRFANGISEDGYVATEGYPITLRNLSTGETFQLPEQWNDTRGYGEGRGFGSGYTLIDVGTGSDVGGYWYYIDKNGNNPFEKNFADASAFIHGYAIVRPTADDPYQIIDTKGNVVLIMEKDQIPYPVSKEGIFIVRCGETVLTETTGEWGGTRREDTQGSYGYMDLNGNWIVEPGKYYDMEMFHNGYGRAYKGNSKGGGYVLVDTKGNEVPCPGSVESNVSSTGLVWCWIPLKGMCLLRLPVDGNPIDPGPGPVVPGPETGFTDVKPGAYYADAVAWAVENGVTDGKSPTTFDPNGNCARAQIVTFLWRAYNKPEPKSTVSPFTDVTDPSAYYYKAVLWAVENGVTDGKSPTVFDPNGTCTRGQAVTFLWRAADKPSASGGSAFTDVTDSNAYYYDAVQWAAEDHITDGKTSTTFAPGETCTRGQIVTFLFRDLAG